MWKEGNEKKLSVLSLPLARLHQAREKNDIQPRRLNFFIRWMEEEKKMRSKGEIWKFSSHTK